MARSKHTPEERQRLCNEARHLQRQGVKFSEICRFFAINAMTLRKWMNDEIRDRIYPKVHNQGRMP